MTTSSHIGPMLLGAAVGGLLGVGLVGCAPAGDDDDAEAAQTSDLAASSELQVKASGITVWVDPVAHPTVRFDKPAWRIDVRTSKNLENVFSFASDDEMGEAIQTSPRKAQVFLDADQLGHMLAGYRLIVDLDAATGSQRQYFISFKLGTKLERFHGSSKITLRKTLTPFLHGGETRYRNLVGVAAGYDRFAVTADEGPGPIDIGALSSHTPVDWTSAALLDVAADAESEIAFSASKGDATVTRFAGVDVGVSSLQITTNPLPLEVWPSPLCAGATQACLDALPADQLDSSSCGTAIEVRPCRRDIPAGDLPTKADFAEHLTDTLEGWYEQHGADVAASGGNTKEEAQALVSPDKVEEVTDSEEDPHAHDLARFVVYRHPDIVWPGSDIVWFGAYDRATGALFEIYDFN
jgi:hypothetical protein